MYDSEYDCVIFCLRAVKVLVTTSTKPHTDWLILLELRHLKHYKQNNTAQTIRWKLIFAILLVFLRTVFEACFFEMSGTSSHSSGWKACQHGWFCGRAALHSASAFPFGIPWKVISVEDLSELTLHPGIQQFAPGILKSWFTSLASSKNGETEVTFFGMQLSSGCQHLPRAQRVGDWSSQYTTMRRHRPLI